MKRYHALVGIPTQYLPPRGRRPVRYSLHAVQQMWDDGWRVQYDAPMHFPGVLDLDTAQLVEVNVKDGAAWSAVWRLRYDEQLDLVVVTLFDAQDPRDRRWLVTTLWFNEATDHHKSLRLEQYETV